MLRNLKLKTTAYAMVAFLSLIALGAAAFSVNAVVNVQDIGEIWEEYEGKISAKASQLARLRDAVGFGGVIHEFKDYVLRQDRERIIRIQASVRDAKIALVAYQAIGVNEAEEKALSDLARVISEYTDGVEIAEAMAAESIDPRIIDAEIRVDDRPAIRAMALLEQELKSAEELSGAAVDKKVAEGVDAAVFSAVIMIGVILLMGGLLSAILLLNTRMMGRMTAVMGGIAAGDLDLEVPGAGNRNEIGEMAASVDVFKKNALERERLERDKAAQDRQAALEKIRSMQEMADTVENETDNVAVDVSGKSQNMLDISERMSNAARRVEENSRVVAQAADNALGNAEAVASASEELSVSITEIAGQVERSNQVSRNAARTAGNTQQIVSSLSEAAQRVGDVIQMISDVAEQTNLLALNATIEAARAGDAGKGFAVVANEVKSLANQTQKAASEITDQIGQMQSITSDAVDAIADIADRVGEITAVSAEISASVSQQSAATAEIANNVQQAAAGVRQVSENISDVSDEASSVGTLSGEVNMTAVELSDNVAGLKSRLSDVVRAAVNSNQEEALREAD